jgi:chromate transporter
VPSLTDGAAKHHRLFEIFKVALGLGLTSFGGPISHLGYFHREYVRKLRWIDEENYAALVALSQFLPGPASSQVGIGVGLRRAGLLGGLAAWLGFTLPSALLMYFAAVGFSRSTELAQVGWLRGLKVVAVAVVAQAVWRMATKICTDRTRITVALAAAAIVLLFPLALMQVALIIAGALFGIWRLKTDRPSPPQSASVSRPVVAIAHLLLFFVLLAGLPILARMTQIQGLKYFDSFYRSGALVFGGGHVVLPLLQREVVPPGWVTNDAFLAGYGAAQALPGPLFTFSAYLGGILKEPPNGLAGSALCLSALFLPSWLLVVGVLPFWEKLREKRWAQAGLQGTNAVVVGLLLAALYEPVWTSAMTGRQEFVLALACFGLLAFFELPPVVVVAFAACVGWLTF